jgi:hypothetical protein
VRWGLAFSTLGVLVLDHSGAGQQGLNSASAQTNDAVVVSLVLALGSVGFAALVGREEIAAYLAVFGLATSIGAMAAAMATRVVPAAS